MDDTILDHIVRSAQILPLHQQGRFIAEKAIKTDRATAAAISDEDLQDELTAWWQLEYGRLPGEIETDWALSWGRHLLSGVRHAT